MIDMPAEKLTVRDRILVHLANFSSNETDHQLPTEVSQQGIAGAVGIRQRHISQYVRPMIVEGLVSEESRYIRGGRQHQKVYFLTKQGCAQADWMNNNSNGKSDMHLGLASSENSRAKRQQSFAMAVE
jgi:predicted transcriptional regulator